MPELGQCRCRGGTSGHSGLLFPRWRLELLLVFLIEAQKVATSRTRQSFAQLREEGAKKRVVDAAPHVAAFDRPDALNDFTTPLLNDGLLWEGHWHIKCLGCGQVQRCELVGDAFAACHLCMRICPCTSQTFFQTGCLA